jgi:hypothetical protein
LTGDVSGSVNFDGSANVTITAVVADDSHNHVISNIDGLQTALDGKLSTTGKAADSDKLDNRDSTDFATNRGQTNWNDNTVINQVSGMLSWKNYGNNHVIFDASNGTTPSGTACDKTNPQNGWTANYPTLMGWNGSNTYGVRVSSAGYADNANALDGLDSTQFLRSDTSDQFVGQLTVDNRGKITSAYSWTGSAIQTTSLEIIDANTDDASSCATMFMHNYGDGGVKFRMGNTGDKTLYLSSGAGNNAGSPTDDNAGTYFNAVKINNNIVWHAGNDGAGSGLDADTLDGVQLAAITRSGSTVTLTGDVTGSATVSSTGSISIATTASGGSGGITTGKAIAMAIVFG